MLAVIVSAMLCRFECYEAMADWIRYLPIEVWHALGGTRKPPCANCFRILMNQICPQQLQQALTTWMTVGLGLDLEEKATAIIIDGKVLRGTSSDHARTLRILAALDQYTGCVLSEAPIPAETNEAKAALEFLKTLILQGKTVVGDAAFCQREICETITAKHGQYLFPIKDNQPGLHQQAVQALVIPEGFSPYAKRKAREARRTARTMEKSRGRVEVRSLTTTTMGTETCDWPGIRQFLKLELVVTVKDKTTRTTAYAVTNHSVASASPGQLR